MRDSCETDQEADQQDSSADLDATTAESSDSSAVGVVYAGITRSVALALKKVGFNAGSMVRTALKRRAFITIGQRTASTSLSAETKSLGSWDPIQSSAQRRAAGVLKGSVLGFAVFGVYDVLIFKRWPEQQGLYFYRNREDNSGDGDFACPGHPSQISLVQAAVERAHFVSPLWAHFAAGALAGLVQSLILDVWEVCDYWWRSRHKLSIRQHMSEGVNYNLVFRRTIHHSLGFSTLFGTYELVRRQLVESSSEFFGSRSLSSIQAIKLLEQLKLVHSHRNDVYDMTIIPIAASFMAGGIAGQVHYVLSHYSSHWKIRPTTSRQTHSVMPKPPQFQLIARAFLPTALCFLAFQYGGELTERWLREDGAMRPYPYFRLEGSSQFHGRH